MTLDKDIIFVSAGEVSGDHYIARLADRLRAMGCGARLRGLCGSESSAHGAESVWNAERLQLLGITEVFASLRDIFALKAEMVREIVRTSPAAVVLVDSPDFNIPLVKAARRDGYRGKVFYISPPSVWAWRSYRVKYLRSYIDECLPLFKFEHEYLVGAGCASRWIGHPLVEEMGDLEVDRASVLASVGMKDDARAIAFLPGSRGSEIRALAPILADICEPLEREGYSPIFSVAPGLSRGASDELVDMLESRGYRYWRGSGVDLMASCCAVVGASGTATAQALLLRKFMVVLYKVSAFSAFVGRLVLRNRFFAVPNILAGEMFFPELIQGGARADRALDAISKWLDMPRAERESYDRRMDALAGLMGDRGALDLWAGRVCEAVS